MPLLRSRHRRRTRSTVAALLTAALAVPGTACAQGRAPAVPAESAAARGAGPPSPASAPATSGAPAAPHSTSFSPALEPQVDGTVAAGLRSPWGLAFLPDGAALVSERDSARIKRLDGKGGVTNLGKVPGVRPGGEGGLLGIAVAANVAKAPFVYAYFTAREDNRIVRLRYSADGLGEPEVVLDGIPRGTVHNGGRLAFGPDGMLYAGTGEVGRTSLSQDPDSLAGKILRMTPGGKVPPDNPTEGSYVFSRGHRNVQGLAFNSAGRLFASEFGQNTFDELNLIRAGGNYGWPAVEGKAEKKVDRRRFTDPIAVWRTSEASPSGIAVADGTVFMAGLRGARLWRIQIGPAGEDGVPAGRDKAFFDGRFGRLRAVERAPDGSLWLVTNNTDGRGVPKPGDDRVIRLRLRGA